MGCIPVAIKAIKTDGSLTSTKEVFYFVEGLQKTFLSRNALTTMGSISKHFPQPLEQSEDDMIAFISEDEDRRCFPPEKFSGQKADCGCPLRTQTPGPPELMKPIDQYKSEELRRILLDHYKASTFNLCKHQTLPMMEGPPLELHVDPSARPHTVHTPATVPVHYEAKVKADLDRDVALGVLEEVPLNTPSTWCARMVIARKHNGDPRRTVDLQPLNDACLRQTHHTAPPLQQASKIPHNTLKTTLDAWNGFHSVKIRESDRHFTTFITPWGRYRYVSSPQGWLASGDSYTPGTISSPVTWRTA